MRYVEAPIFNSHEGTRLFVAGGITGCPDWQSEFVGSLKNTELIICNPRRKNWPIDNPSVRRAQRMWEHAHLQEATAISFWFPCETLCPSTLFELGRWLPSNKSLFVGVHPEYKRRLDVEIQLELDRPDLKIVYLLTDLSTQVLSWYQRLKVAI